ncbi:leucine efflux protein LeuE [Polynucleobacter necessarius]|uniref:leucine efflux protein LeuE n=1 Tax=Polynucleobacter necessarius TaxID=576610 RepID=UPI0013B04D8E|nr:leucine efflux protein LeuE [Polynucleobacter necessarius]
MEWLSFSLLSPTSAGIIGFPSYLLGTIFIILLPGPNSLYVLTIAIQKGWRFGAWGALGIFIGDSILMMAVALGAATLLLSSPFIFIVVRALGALYLGWMGVGLVRNGLQRWKLKESAATHSDLQMRIMMRLHPLLAALTLSLTNPKAIFFFIAFFSQFIQPEFASPTYAFIYLAVVLQMLSMTYLACLIAVGQCCFQFFQNQPRLTAVLWLLAGILFIGFAMRLLFA